MGETTFSKTPTSSSKQDSAIVEETTHQNSNDIYHESQTIVKTASYPTRNQLYSSMPSKKQKQGRKNRRATGVEEIQVVEKKDRTRTSGTQSAALEKQLRLRVHNKGIDYILMTPPPAPADFAVNFSNSEGRLFFKACEQKAIDSGDSRSLWMMYDMLKNQTSQISPALVRHQLRQEYGVDPFDGKPGKETNATKSTNTSTHDPEDNCQQIGIGREAFGLVISSKEAGNRAFVLGLYEEALNHYRVALGHFKRKDVTATVNVVQKTEHVKLLSNSAECYLKLNDAFRAEKTASSAIAIDGNHIKSLYRRATARLTLAQEKDASNEALLQAALTDIQVVLDDNTSNRSVSLQLLNKIKRQMQLSATGKDVFSGPHVFLIKVAVQIF